MVKGLKRLESNADDRSEALFALQKGAWAALPPGGASVADIGRLVLGLDEDAFQDEVRTIMINGKVVDHPKRTVPVEGDVLIFSGAMPGLVGAMLRSDSPLKAMRAPVTEGSADAAAGTAPDCPYPGFIKVKAFNTVLRNHLDDIVSYGVHLEEASDG